MHPDVSALLAVQEDDLAIDALEQELAALRPRLDQMAKERDRAIVALNAAKQAAEAEERRRAEVADRVAQHKALHDKNQAALNAITSMREATAATAQLEQAKRMIDEDERELGAIGQRLQDANHTVAERERTAAELETAQETARASLSADQAKLENDLERARAERLTKAQQVPRTLLSQYDRMRSRRRSRVVFPLNGDSCGNCDTMIPMQRRSAMTGSSRTELCEGCGMMLYAPE